MMEIEVRKRQLEDRLKELKWKLVEVENALDSPKDRDSEERAVQQEGDEVLEKLGLSGQQEIAMIKSALDRIKAGSYGVCAKCGEDISQMRLDAVPYSPLCKNCARE